MMPLNPMLATDAYKVGHYRMYPEGLEALYSNFTARSTRIPELDYTVFFGLQGWITSFLEEQFRLYFFGQPRQSIARQYMHRIDSLLGPGHPITVDHITDLWDLGYLPIRICALPEGTRVPLRVPMLTIESTNPRFAWLVNYFETIMSASLWGPITAATLADRLRNMLDEKAELAGDPGFVQFQGHDFSMRGLMGLEATMLVGAGHLLSFVGSDTLPAMEYLEWYYSGGASGEMVGVSVAATEHSVMCAGGEDDELGTYSRLLDTHPTGILSVVSDTWDLWFVLTVILPALKDKIMGREGKLVIRPDSGDPADIICGIGEDPYAEDTPATKGVVELLWDIFGGTINEKGYKVLDPHVGAIYGDSINFERAQDISDRLIAKGFSPENIVYGVGSYTYQFVTRDTFGMAMKATWVKINGEGQSIFKDPVTDSGSKKSARGRLAVLVDPRDDKLYLLEDASPEAEAASLLKPIWEDGNWIAPKTTLQEIRERLGHA